MTMTAFDEVAQAVVGKYAPDRAKRLSDMLLRVAASPDAHAWHDRMIELALDIERIELHAPHGEAP